MTDRRAEALERLDQWERDAKAAPAGPWVATGAGEVSCPRGLIIENPCSSLDSPDCHHIANFGPDVALRLIEGLRAVLGMACECGIDGTPACHAHNLAADRLADAILGTGAEDTQEATDPGVELLRAVFMKQAEDDMREGE